jgi:hypothetical protein
MPFHQAASILFSCTIHASAMLHPYSIYALATKDKGKIEVIPVKKYQPMPSWMKVRYSLQYPVIGSRYQ